MQVDRVESKGSIAATAAVHSSTTTTVIGALAVDRRSSPSDKVKLFRSLFRGREDVYPVRFESRKTGRAGYSPACANEWVRGVCEKPRIKCSDCPHQRWLPVTDETVTWHLSGKDAQGNPFVMGVYPMLRDERCYFLAIDFDEGTWEADALAYLETCRCLGLTAALERSRSGAGGHVWLFFNDAVPAGAARRLGSYLLTETMERRPSVGLKSYDRLFPNQDTLPRGGFGNLIALPLQQGPRQKGNSLFVDEQLRPFDDQWAFLSQLGRITSNQLEQHVVEAERRGRVVGVRFVAEEEGQALDSPWDLPPSRKRKEPPIVGKLPSSLEVILADQIYLEKQDLPPALLNRLIRLSAFQNPEFYRAQSMRLPTYDKPRIISCAEETPSHLGLPRGCEDDLRSLMKELGVSVKTTDKRSSGNPLTAKFLGELRPEQLTAAKAMLAHDFGVLSATTAFGKTVLAAWLIAQRGVNTLILGYFVLRFLAADLALHLDSILDTVLRALAHRRRRKIESE